MRKGIALPIYKGVITVTGLYFFHLFLRFTDCLSRAAVSTKFAQHSRRGTQIIGDIAATMSDVNARAVNEVRAQTNLKKEIWDRRDFILKQLELMTLDVKNKIHSITEDVEYKVVKLTNRWQCCAAVLDFHAV